MTLYLWGDLWGGHSCPPSEPKKFAGRSARATYPSSPSRFLEIRSSEAGGDWGSTGTGSRRTGEVFFALLPLPRNAALSPLRRQAPWVCLPGPGRHGGRPSRSCCATGLHPRTRPSRRPALQVWSGRLVTLSWRGGLPHALSRHGSASRDQAVTEGRPSRSCRQIGYAILEGRAPARPVAPWVSVPGPGRRRPALQVWSGRLVTLSWRGGLRQAWCGDGSPFEAVALGPERPLFIPPCALPLPSVPAAVRRSGIRRGIPCARPRLSASAFSGRSTGPPRHPAASAPR